MGYDALCFGAIVAIEQENHNITEMKKIYSLLVSLVMVATVNDLRAADHILKQQSDTTLLSEWVDGDYLVRRYKITSRDDEAQYSLKYSISASKLNSLLSNNATELADLDKMMAELKSDANMHIKYIDITGYASPDGNALSNEALALSRAQKFRSMLDTRYAMLSSYKVNVMANAEQWDDCDDAVLGSSITNKEAVLNVLNSATSEAAKEQRLKQMPQAWSVFRSQILPPMRRVEMVVYYNMDREVEVRTLVEKPKPAPKPQPQRICCPCNGMIVDETVGFIVDLCDPDTIY